MLKQQPIRNQRSEGFKVKHVAQIFLFVAICIWLLNQVKHSYGETKGDEESSANISEIKSEIDPIKFGRKDLNNPRVEQAALESERHGVVDELEGEIEESKVDEFEDEGRGVGDDEIDGNDQEKAEEEESEAVEDFIDVDDDQEREDESEEQEESDSDETWNEGTRHSRVAREEQYTSDDASSAVGQNAEIQSGQFEMGGLKKVKEDIVEGNNSDPVLGTSVMTENGVSRTLLQTNKQQQQNLILYS